jgi:valyl-tRNA synthetase
MKELAKTYNPKDTENAIYQKWEASGFFNPDNLEKASDRFWNAEVFSIAMPPPNITAVLHLGSALFLTIEDIMTRYARMSGKKTLWLPGTDHAAIATNSVVERQIWEQEKKSLHDIGREEFLRRVEEFISQTRGRIQVQIRAMGSSCDWSREKYTFSPELSVAVRTIFKKFYDAGLIYRGERIVNWCPHDGTTLADDEVEYRPTQGQLYYIRYHLTQGKGVLTVATTRPETMLGDTALAVHPQDPRYKQYVGQHVMLPIVNRELPVVADEEVDREFGSGVLKVTPGHDPHDFEIGKRHNLETINLFTPEGKINEQEAYDHGFEEFANLTAPEARAKIVQALTEAGFLEKTESLTHNVGVCYRCENIVEPIVSKQWFVDVNKKIKLNRDKFQSLLKLPAEASLREIGTASVKSGAIKIIPERFGKIYLQWMDNLHDWNISRQIWFGHRIPVWYCDNCGETIVAVDAPQTCSSCGKNQLTQDPDTLDTWFSSSLWTFSTLGWPKETVDLMTYHPTTILETGYDILFFWVARMILMTGFALEDIPFHTVYLHGLVRDLKGKKMSKSKGNVVNPLDMIEKYGTDALRLSLILGTTPGNDSKTSETKIQNYRNFVNKLWNISRFILSSSSDEKTWPGPAAPDPQTLADQWILSQLDILTAKVRSSLDAYQYSLAGELLETFTWTDLADWYVEVSKVEKGKGTILKYLLGELLKLWHPFIPFVTEQLWSQFSPEFLMIQPYPQAQTAKNTKELGEKFLKLQQLISGLRNLRAEYHQPPAPIFASYLELLPQFEWLKEQTALIEKLARVKLNLEAVDATKKMPYFLWENQRVYLIMPNFDPDKELMLAEKELKITEILRKKFAAQLNKKDFASKAPAEVVATLQRNFAEAEERAKKLKTKLESLR